MGDIVVDVVVLFGDLYDFMIGVEIVYVVEVECMWLCVEVVDLGGFLLLISFCDCLEFGIDIFKVYFGSLL